MPRAQYTNTIADFLHEDCDKILGTLSRNSNFSIDQTQLNAWRIQIELLKPILTSPPINGTIYFEYSIPRLGKRIDTLLLIGPLIAVLEFKVGESKFHGHAMDQVWDYALDLKNFHEPSHHLTIAPILIPTESHHTPTQEFTRDADRVYHPIKAAPSDLACILHELLAATSDKPIPAESWHNGRYAPTPTIIEAATALYRGHNVAEISRSDAQENLATTTKTISQIIESSRSQHHKSICFVTGVPGAGKTLVGLNTATTHIDKTSELHTVFLSGNGPLVKVLREALVRDKVATEKLRNHRITKSDARRPVEAFIQNVHHYRDEYLRDPTPPHDHVAIFDEAQRAWTLEQTRKFMLQKKKRPNFNQSEPEFLISCLDRHQDWATILCLVGGGQEINTGEAGISEWIDALQRTFSHWHIHISSRLTDNEYGAGEVIRSLRTRPNVHFEDNLHLAVSMRSFRAESVSLLVKQILDLELAAAKETFAHIHQNYPIALTRNLHTAKSWLRKHARASERYGIVVSSEAQRLKPHAIDVKSPMDPIHWFLDDKRDVRSSYYLEDVATEFHVQGLELDWACVTWDGDFRFTPQGWQHHSFCGSRWNNIKHSERQKYLKNAYRVLLTRARQGMVICVPEGDPTNDHTRQHQFYDPTYEYLRSIGIPTI